jgi:hypothetical protein
MEGSASCVDELRHFFLAEKGGQAVAFLGIGSVGNAPRFFERLDVENRSAHRWVVTVAGDNFRVAKR